MVLQSVLETSLQSAPCNTINSHHTGNNPRDYSCNNSCNYACCLTQRYTNTKKYFEKKAGRSPLSRGSVGKSRRCECGCCDTACASVTNNSDNKFLLSC